MVVVGVYVGCSVDCDVCGGSGLVVVFVICVGLA